MSNVVPLVGARSEGAARPEGRVVTQSEMACFMRDRRLWYLSWYRRLRPIRDTAYVPKVGTLYHAGLEAYYKDKTSPLDVVQRRAQSWIEAHPHDEVGAEQLLKAAELAAIMLEGYLEWLQAEGADAHLKVLSAEEKVEVPLRPSPFVLRGKIDARAIDLRTEARVQLEHKTVQDLGTLPRYAQSNFQFLTYDLLAFLQASELNDPSIRTDGILLNMARRVKRTIRANPPFYARHEVRHNTQELRAHWKHVVAIAREIERATQRLDAGEEHHYVCPPNVSRDSTWSNPFLPVYAVMDDGGDAEGMLRDLYEEHDPLERYEEDDD